MENKKIILIVIATLVIGAGIGWILKPSGPNPEGQEMHDHQVESSDHQEVWTCSMHPQIRQSEPGNCPICGMELILLTAETGDSQNYTMSEDAMKLANITTIVVGKGSANKELRLNGKVQVDERNAYSQSTHIPGRIEQLSINFTGEKVSRGQTLATVYSPQLVTAQEELLQAASIKESQPELFAAAKEKLRNWKIGDSQINKILSTGKAIQRFPISADVDGIVTEKMVDLGDYVERGMPIYEISDLSKVWVLFDLYESDLNWVKEGSKITYTINSIPGEIFEGNISFIDPLIDVQTRVASARVEVNNKDGKLKPEMFASGVVVNDISRKETQEIVIPKSSVLWTGKRSVVYIKEAVGHRAGFNLREVVLGPALGDSYIVTNGLLPGDEIVSNGTFTVDAAVQLSGRPSMMNPEMEAADKTMSVPAELSSFEKGKFQPLLENYLDLKDALVTDDFLKATKEINKLKPLLEELGKLPLNAENTKIWKSFQKELLKATNSMNEGKSIDAIRSDFNELSETLIGLVNTFKLNNKTLYVLHCPMADDNKGADWLSVSSEVKNPYYGSAMLGCGEVKRTMNPN